MTKEKTAISFNALSFKPAGCGKIAWLVGREIRRYNVHTQTNTHTHTTQRGWNGMILYEQSINA